MHRSLVILLIACGGKSEEPPAAGSAPVGKRAFIKRLSTENWRVLISDLEGSCPELMSGVVEPKPGATTISLIIAKQVAPDGKESLAVHEFATAGHASEIAIGPVEFTGSAEVGKTATIVLPKLVDPGGTATVGGTITATGCGDEPATTRVTHPSAATITIAGNKLELRGIVLFDADIVLSSEPIDCTETHPNAQVVLRHLNDWALSGSWIVPPIKYATDKELEGLTLHVGKTGTAPDGKIAAIELGGTAMIGGYKIELTGTAEALDCPAH